MQSLLKEIKTKQNSKLNKVTRKENLKTQSREKWLSLETQSFLYLRDNCWIPKKVESEIQFCDKILISVMRATYSKQN